MADLVERVAKALYQNVAGGAPVPDDWENYAPDYRSMARAAIAEVLNWLENPSDELAGKYLWPESFRAERKAIAAELRVEALGE